MAHQRIVSAILLAALSCLLLCGCSGNQEQSKPAPDGASAANAPAGQAQASPPSAPADAAGAQTATPAVAEVTIDDTPRSPATVAEAEKWLDLRTFPVVEGAAISGDRRQVGELYYEAPGSLQEVFDFQRKALEDAGWKLLPGGRLDGENPMANFTQHGFLVNVSVGAYAQTPGHVTVFLKNRGNVLAEKLPTPAEVEPLYSMPGIASYFTTKGKAETAEAVWKLLLDDGWKPYGQAGDSRYFKQNAILLSASVMTHDAQPGKTFINYTVEQLSADLPVSEAVADPRYTDSMKRLHFDQEGATPADVAEFYNAELAKLGWKPTSEPVGDDEVSVVYRNDAGEMITLDMQVYGDMTRVDVEHFTAAEIAALEEEAKRAAQLAQQKAAEDAAEEEARHAAARIELPIPDKARNIEQEDEHRLTFVVASGAGQGVLAAYKKHFNDAGWKTETSTVSTNFGMLQLEKGDFSLTFDFVDAGLGGDVEIEISSFEARLIPEQAGESFAEVGSMPAPAPIPPDVLAKAPADIAIPTDVRDLKVRPNANIEYDVAASVDRVADYLRETMEAHGWTHHGTDIDEDTGSVSFRKGRAPCSAALIQHGGQLTSVTIAGGGMNWKKLRAADQELDPAVGADPEPDPSTVVDADRPAEADSDAPAEAVGGRVLAEKLAVPEGAKDVERNADTEMVIFRSELAASKIAEFYRKAMAKVDWSEIEDETFVDDDLAVGAVSFEHGDLGIRVAIQDGRPDSKSRVLVMGDGLQWPGQSAETYAAEEAAEEMPEEPEVAQAVGSGKAQGKIEYDDKSFEMKHALAAIRESNGAPITRLYLCGGPFPEAALATIARKDASTFDLTGFDSPPTIEFRLGESFASINCYVDGTSVSLGSDKIKSTVKREKDRLQGRVYLEEPEDFFDKPFKFDVQVDIALKDAAPLVGDEPGGLVASARYDLLVPEDCSEVFQQGSPYRQSITASIDAELAEVAKFYRAELDQRGYKENADAAKEAEEAATMVFTGEEGPLTVELKRRRGETMIVATVVRDAQAKKDGIAPPRGKAMLVLGNATEAAIEIKVDGKSHKLKAEQGAREPADAVKLTLEPGKHTVAAPGAKPEEIDIPAGASWGVIVIPEVGVFSERIY